jgi:hypothetical protein
VIRLAGHAGALLLGAAVAVASLAVHRDVLAGFPAGLVFVAVVSVYVALVLRHLAAPGRTAASYCLGWLAVLSYALLGRPEGDYLVAADLEGYGLIVIGLVIVLVLLSSLVRRDAASR